MRIGLYEIDITPPLGVNIPGYFESRIAAGIRDNLYARAMACETAQGDSFILINMDAITADAKMTAQTRARVEKLTGVPGSRVMVSATHTHTGGPLDAFVPGTIDEGYMFWLADRAADAAALAWKQRKPAKIGCGKGYEDSIAFIRRYYMKDGTFRTNPGYHAELIDRPAGDIDPEVGLVKIVDMDGRLIGVITNYACHLDTVSGHRYSADYPGELARVLKSVYGQHVVSIFLTGACGNINHCNFLGRTQEYYTKANPPHYIRMGRILAGTVLRALADIETAETDALNVETASFPALIRTPSEEDIKAAQDLLKKHPYEVVVSTEEGIAGDRTDLVPRHYARSLLEVAQIREKQVFLPVQAVRLGETAIVGVPCELFVEFGLDIKKRGGFEHTMISTLTNAQFGYIAVRDAFDQGGYETQISGDTMMAPDTGYDMADTAVSLLSRLQ